MLKTASIFFLLLIIGIVAGAQNVLQPTTTKDSVEILPGTGKLEVRDGLQILSGGVKLKQGTTLFTTDSCVMNPATHQFEAFGNVFINDSDTAKVWANYMRYLWDTKMAYLTGKVKLTDGHVTLTTNTLEYDANNKIGVYNNGGQVLSGKTKLNSTQGTYYLDTRDFYFRNKVDLKDPAYDLKSDSLLYNTESQVARFIANTTIRDTSGRVIQTREGIYDARAGRADFLQRTTIREKNLFIAGDRIASDDATGIIQIEGRGVVIDSAKGTNLLADRIFANKKTDALLATQFPVMMIKQDKDPFFVAADTLFTARLSELFSDSLTQAHKGDSTDRYIEAYRNVRVFSDSMQSVSDSLFYSLRDSVFRLYQNPVVWSRTSQISGDTIMLYTKNKKADRFQVYDNSFIASEVQPGVYNQIRSSRMDGYFKEGSIDSVRAKGLAQSVYFIQDKDSAFTSVNQTTSDVIDIFFANGELNKVVLRSDVKGDLYPISQKKPGEMRLENFIWLEEKRPKSKYDLYQ
ncbi:MAG: OstA-like protein [Flavisolibacter sp.]